MPAILVETAFISNSSDANLLNTRQDDFANAIFNEILNYFNMSISTSTILDQINNSGFAELFGVKFTQTLQEKILLKLDQLKLNFLLHEVVAIMEKLLQILKMVVLIVVHSK